MIARFAVAPLPCRFQPDAHGFHNVTSLALLSALFPLPAPDCGLHVFYRRFNDGNDVRFDPGNCGLRVRSRNKFDGNIDGFRAVGRCECS